MVSGCLSLSLRSLVVVTCLSLPTMVALSLSYCLCGKMELLHVSHYLILLLAVSHCLSYFLAVSHCLSGSMDLFHVSNFLLLLLASLTVSPSFVDLLHVSYCLPWLLAVSHCLSEPMELLHVSLSLMVACCLSLSLGYHGVDTSFALSTKVFCSLSLSLPVPWICCMSLTVFHGCWLFLTVSLVPCRC